MIITGRWSRRLMRGVYLLILTVGALVMFIPFAWSLSTTFKPLGEAMAYPPIWIPRPWDFANIVRVWRIVPLAHWFINSLIVGFAVMIGNVFLDSLAGYALARMRFRGRNAIFMGIVAMLMIPFQSVMLPVYILLRDLGLIDTYAGMILPVVVSAFGVFLMRQAFLNIPQELEDAAVMDGHGRFSIYWRIALPLVQPSLLTLALLQFLSSWNNFLLPLLVANRSHLWTLPLGIVMFQQEYFVNWPYLMAASVLATVPVALFFLLFQKWFVPTVATTGLR